MFMDELIKQGQWWWVLLPIVTAVFAVAGSWLGAKLGKDNEHEQWLRDRRLEKYTTYANACKHIISVRNGMQEVDESKFFESFATLSLIDVELVASKKVQSELDSFNKAFFEYTTSKELSGKAGNLQKNFQKAVKTLNAAFRRDLKIKD
jgi:hypothetical protein